MTADGRRLFFFSVLLLLLETANIRWLGGYIPAIAYFSNAILISTFFGFGLGCRLAAGPERRWTVAWSMPLVLFVLVGGAAVLGEAPISLSDHAGEFIWAQTPGATVDLFGGFADSLQAVISLIRHGILDKGLTRRYLPIEALIIGFFFLNSLLFVPLGVVIGRLFARMEPIRAYSINILGSLVGVVLMMLASWRALPPVFWYVAAALLWYGGLEASWRRRGLLLWLLPLGLILLLDTSVFWSPYSKIRLSFAGPHLSERQPFTLMVGEHFHQAAEDHSGEPNFDTTPPRLSNYDLPFLLPGTGRDAVLIIGAGTGNDVAGALRAGAGRVTAVEIDPTIVYLGRTLHPEAPYSDARVQVVVDDGRRFVERTRDVYDLIIYGLVDSHGLFSNYSSVRLDSFLYTEQGMRAAVKRLGPHGRLVISFAVVNDWLGVRLVSLVRRVLPHVEVIRREGTFIIVGAREPLAAAPERQIAFEDPAAFPVVANQLTDDWPFLYLREKSVPRHYFVFVAAILLIVAGVTWRLTPVRAPRPTAAFFLLGAAFLLLESASVTRMAVLFGATWVVNGFVFISILIAVLLANLLVERRLAPSLAVIGAGLFVALAVLYMVPVRWFLLLPAGFASPLAGLIIGAPLFFASLLFSRLFQKASDPPDALGANLLGAVAGGFLEYGSMAVGFPPLVLIAAALYALALAVRPRA